MSSSKRPVILMGILLVLVAGFATRSVWDSAPAALAAPAVPATVDNKISDLQVRKEADGRWIASVAYEYSGNPPSALLRVYSLRADAAALAPDAAGDAIAAAVSRGAFRPAATGKHRVDIEMSRPPEPALAFTTTQVGVQMQVGHRVLATRQVAHEIDWLDWHSWLEARSQVGKTPEDHLREAVTAIDMGNRGSLAEAKRILERLVARNPQFDPAYVELARVSMKANWGPAGLRQAESLLASALQIRPDSVNAKILQGYVFAHQRRYKEAEALFVQASATDTKNLWLWANWGEVLEMQGRINPAIVKYREAVTRPRTHDTYDRARLHAYHKLIELLEPRGDLDGMEALHRQRAAEFGPGSCHSADYARFLVQKRGDAAGALVLARQAVDGSCGNDDGRQALGLVHYVAWASATGAQRDEALHLARVYFPPSTNLVYQLASSDMTLKTARALKTSGNMVDMIDMVDVTGFNALWYALDRNEFATARRLLQLGAKTDAPVGPDGMPVALLPVVTGNLEGVRLMQQFGTDYSQLKHQGMTAIDHAKRVGDQRLLDLLNLGART